MIPREFLDSLPLNNKVYSPTRNPLWSTDDLLLFAKMYHEQEQEEYTYLLNELLDNANRKIKKIKRIINR